MGGCREGSGEACLDGSCWAVDGVMERRVAGAICHFQTLSSSTLSATCRSSLQRMKICTAQIKRTKRSCRCMKSGDGSDRTHFNSIQLTS